MFFSGAEKFVPKTGARGHSLRLFFLGFWALYRLAGHGLFNIFFRDAQEVKDMVEAGEG
jgi:hypothetical protein